MGGKLEDQINIRVYQIVILKKVALIDLIIKCKKADITLDSEDMLFYYFYLK